MEAAGTSRTATSQRGVRVIEPPTGLGFPDIRELREYVDLGYLLARRDVAVRYRQTAIGAVWAIIQPAALAAVISVFLGLLAKVPSQGDIPYPLYAFSGMVMWLYFSQALARSSESTIAAGPLISKIYFPRILFPLVAVVAPALDFIVAFAVLLVVMVGYGYFPGPEIALFPVAFLLAVATALGIGLWFSAFAVRWRDIQHVVPFLLLVGMFITPIVYPFGLVPDALQPLYAINPLVGVLELYRFALFGEMTGDAWLVAIPAAISCVLIVTGAAYFARAERSFADAL